MNAIEELIGTLQLLAFLAATGLIGVLWVRQGRRRPHTYLLLAFVALTTVILVARLPDGVPPPAVWGRLAPLVLMVSPAAFASFAWSFAGRLRPWMLAVLAGAFVPALYFAVWPAPPLEEQTTLDRTAVWAFLVAWTVLTFLAAVRLWRAGPVSRAVRTRLRLLAVGGLLLNVSLLLAVWPRIPGGAWVTAITIVAALLAVVAFAAPDWVRRIWRAETTDLYADVQRSLIAARTPEEVYAGALPRCAELLGGDVALLDEGGAVLASHGLTDDQRRRLSRDWRTDQLGDDHHLVQAGRMCFVVRLSPYAPVMGSDDRRLAEGLALHLEAALDRAELFQAQQRARAEADGARAEAERSREELESTVVGLAHDLRNPTVSLAGFAHLINLTDDPAERREMVDHLTSSAQYIERLVESLLEISRIGRTQTERQAVDVEALASRVAERWQSQYPEARICVDALPVLEVNPGRFEQLLDNLIGNALRHGGRSDLRVQVKMEIRRDGLRLIVSDDGVGIAAEDREAVFQLFHRGRNASMDGTGVGLSVVQRIARSYGGHAEILDGDGATLVVHLPTTLLPATR